MKVARILLPMLSDPIPMQDLKNLPVYAKTVAVEEGEKRVKKGKKEKRVKLKGFSLAQLCVEYLGEGAVLEKTFQVSAWLRRPLLQSQIVYAEADAVVLLDILVAYEKRRGD
jgi:hypothetical protein